MRIQSLYREGKRFTVWPLRITYRTPQVDSNAETHAKVLIWAPKSLFKHAVDRNRLRRQMREAYRLNKTDIETKGLEIAINYMDKIMQPYSVIERAMKRALKRIE